MDLLTLYWQQIELTLLAWARISGLFLMAPIFSSKNVPMLVKIGLSGLLAIISANFILPAHIGQQPLEYIIIIIMELTIGIMIALLTQVIFAAIQLAGQLIDMQMGFFIVNVVDPEHGTQVPLMGNFKFLIALAVFLIVDGHHMVINAIVNSFELIPIGNSVINESLVSFLISTFTSMFIIALKLAAPVVGTLFVVSVALGIIARTVPQMNVFMVGMPAIILIGLGILFISMPLYIYLLNSLFSRNFSNINQFIYLLN